MEPNLNKDRHRTEHATDIATTYTFEIEEDNLFHDFRHKMKADIWQIFPSSCASLTGIPFGLMLGWPSPTYPTLLQPDSPLPISLDQSALIAGFLMLGVSLGTLFSSRQIASCSKYGIVFGNLLIVVGWMLMFQSKNVYWVLGSRIVLGTGYGYAVVQTKMYIKEMNEEQLSDALSKVLHFYGLTGFVTAYIIGPFVDFRLFSVIALIISIFILFITIFLPLTPKELIRSKKINDAKRLIAFLKPSLDPQVEAIKITEAMDNRNSTNTLMDIRSNDTLKYNFLKFTLLVFCQQYSGIPPTLVYTQIIFTKSLVPYPQYFSIAYAILFLLSNVLGIYLFPNYNKKKVLLFSSICTLFLYICKILVIYYNINEQYFPYTSVIVMYLLVILNTIGLGSIPFSMIADLFPSRNRSSITKYFTILHCIFALTVTKIFQVLLGRFDFFIPFCLLAAISLFAIVFIIFFISSSHNCKFTAKGDVIKEITTKK